MCKVAIKASHCLVNAVGEPYYYCEYYCGILLRIKALALQKRPLFVLFALAGRTTAILDVAMLCAVEGAQCKRRELP